MKSKLFYVISIMLIASMITACDSKPTNTEESSYRVLSFTTSEESPALVTSSRPAELDSSSSEESSAETSHHTESAASNASSKSSESVLASSKKESRIVSSSITSSTVETYTIYYHETDQNHETHTENSEAGSSEGETSSEINSSVVPDTDSDTDTSFSSLSSSEPLSYGSYTEDDIAFYYNSSVVRLGDDAKTALAILGEPLENDSINYNYSDFWVSLTEGDADEEKKVSEIQIFGSEIETEKGVKVGMKLDEVLEIYGESSSIVNGEYRYYFENKYMYIYLQNDVVLNIGYRIDIEVETSEV